MKKPSHRGMKAHINSQTCLRAEAVALAGAVLAGLNVPELDAAAMLCGLG